MVCAEGPTTRTPAASNWATNSARSRHGVCPIQAVSAFAPSTCATTWSAGMGEDTSGSSAEGGA